MRYFKYCLLFVVLAITLAPSDSFFIKAKLLKHKLKKDLLLKSFLKKEPLLKTFIKKGVAVGSLAAPVGLLSPATIPQPVVHVEKHPEVEPIKVEIVQPKGPVETLWNSVKNGASSLTSIFQSPPEVIPVPVVPEFTVWPSLGFSHYKNVQYYPVQDEHIRVVAPPQLAHSDDSLPPQRVFPEHQIRPKPFAPPQPVQELPHAPASEGPYAPASESPYPAARSVPYPQSQF